jgi:hypothetical protein
MREHKKLQPYYFGWEKNELLACFSNSKAKLIFLPIIITNPTIFLFRLPTHLGLTFSKCWLAGRNQCLNRPLLEIPGNQFAGEVALVDTSCYRPLALGSDFDLIMGLADDVIV